MADKNENENKNEGTTEEPQGGFMETDRHFMGWLNDTKASLVVSSYKANKLLFIGSTVNKKTKTQVPSIWMSEYLRPMGVHVKENRLYLGTANMLWTHVENGSRPTHDETFDDFDTSYVPRTLNYISDIDCHDIVEDSTGQVYFVSSLFGCVCTPSPTHSFKVFWSPPWQDKIAAEDRCHLNGLCLDESGKPRYVTSISRNDVRGGWRENRTTGGVVFDIVENTLICKDICMPHSPRMYKGKLWVLESGTGYLGWVDFSDKVISTNKQTGEEESHYKFVKEIFIPGYLRGLSFVGKYAVVGTSLDRHEKVFQDIPLGDNVKNKGVTAKCGIFIIDTESMDVVHEVSFDQQTENSIKEIYDVCVIPNSKRCMSENINDDKLLREYRVDK